MILISEFHSHGHVSQVGVFIDENGLSVLACFFLL